MVRNLSPLEKVLRSSGRLRHEDQALLARALLLILERRGDFPEDPEEALVQAVATLRVIEDRKGE